MTYLAESSPGGSGVGDGAAGGAPPRLAVLGAGAWGTVIAALLARAGAEVTLWARRAEVAEAIDRTRRNPEYVRALELPPAVRASADLDAATAGAEAIFLVVSSGGLRSTLERLSPAPGIPLVSCAKGMRGGVEGGADGSFLRFSEVIAAHHPAAPVAVLSGPNLAAEIAAGLPAAATVAAHDEELAARVQRWLHQGTFRVYSSRDVTGVEVAGAMKNVIALAAGMCDGLGLGDNARAGIITRGLAEIVRLGQRLGGRAETFYGLAGVGDLIATCASAKSRNHAAGERLARGATLANIRASGLTAEGIPTVRAVHAHAEREGLELPITAAVHGVIFDGVPPQRALERLMGRDTKDEWET